jgi:hypothetical protein
MKKHLHPQETDCIFVSFNREGGPNCAGPFGAPGAGLLPCGQRAVVEETVESGTVNGMGYGVSAVGRD